MNKKYIYLIVATILGLFIGGKWNIPLAAWIAPIFSLRFFRESDKAGRNFLLLWLVSTIPSIISWKGGTFFPPIAEAAFFLAMAPISLLPYVIDRMYYRRFGSTAWLTLVYPIAATAVDYFSANGPFGTFGAVGYTQRDFLPIMQIVSVTGLWGVTFVMSWFASLVNHFWDKKPAPLSWTFAGSLVLILSLSLGRTLLPAQPEQTAIIAGFSMPNDTISSTMKLHQNGDEAKFLQATDELHAQQLEQIRAFAQDGANIVVLQEGAILGMSDQIKTVMQEAAIIAKEENIYIVLPTFDLGKTPAVNSVHIIDPNGDVALTHVKYGGNMFEGTLKGDEILQSIDTPYGRLSAVICWDADFPNIIKQTGEQDVDLLFIPANDWLGVKDIHAGMSAFRAVENGMSIFRQTGQGVSIAANAYGKVLSHVDTFEENNSSFAGIQIVEMPIGSVNTLYPSIGDTLGNVMLLGLVGLLIGLWVTRKR